MSADERVVVESKLAAMLVGGPERVQAGIDAFIERTGVDEIMFTSEAFLHTERLRSLEIVASLMRESRLAAQSC